MPALTKAKNVLSMGILLEDTVYSAILYYACATYEPRPMKIDTPQNKRHPQEKKHPI